jgi:hypothetical protein
MKSGINLALLLGVVTAVAGATLKAMHLPGANGTLVAGLFVVVIAFAFRVLQNAPGQHE